MTANLDLDVELRDIVGVGNFEYQRAMAVTGPMPMAMFNNYVNIIDKSGVPQQLEEWAALERSARHRVGGRRRKQVAAPALACEEPSHEAGRPVLPDAEASSALHRRAGHRRRRPRRTARRPASVDATVTP